MTKELYGKQQVEEGERCTNPGWDDRFTTPCCYEDFHDNDLTECPNCGAPIWCSIESQPVAVCTIGIKPSLYED